MHLVILIFIYFLLGSFVGVLSGLLGIGGGIVVVPALAFIFRHEHIPAESVMHLAVGTSLAIMVCTAMRSLKAHLSHHGKGRQQFFDLSRKLIPAVMIGVVFGAIFADFLHSSYLKFIFGIVIFLIAIRILLGGSSGGEERSLPRSIWMRVAGLIMGVFSGLLGIGGGATVIPYLLHWNVSMRVAVRVAILVGMVVAIVGAIAYFFAGLNEPLPAHTLGYIYWPAWIGTAMGSVLFAPLGVKLSYLLPTDVLRKLFAVLMIVIAVHMLFFK